MPQMQTWLEFTSWIKNWDSLIDWRGFFNKPKIFGHQKIWTLSLRRIKRMRFNEEIRRLTEQPLITSVIKTRRLQWVGHVSRAFPTLKIRQVLNGRPTSPKPFGRPRLRWEDNVSMDVGRLGIQDWRAIRPDNRLVLRLQYGDRASCPVKPLMMMVMMYQEEGCKGIFIILKAPKSPKSMIHLQSCFTNTGFMSTATVILKTIFLANPDMAPWFPRCPRCSGTIWNIRILIHVFALFPPFIKNKS